MTATTAAPTFAPTGTAGRVTFGRIVRSEWTKLVTLRSTWWTTAVAVLLIVGIGLLVAFDGSAGDTVDPLDFAAGSLLGSVFAQLVLGVLAVLVITGEYGTGMIRSSMGAVPRRLPVLWAKALVYSLFVLPVTFVTSVVTLVLSGLVLRGKGVGVPSLLDADVLRVTFGVPLTIVAAGLVGLGIGTLVRATAGGVAALVGLFFVVPLVAVALPSVVQPVVPYLPSNAAGSLTGLTLARGSADPLAPWPGFAVLCAWAVVLLVAAAWRLRRGDV